MAAKSARTTSRLSASSARFYAQMVREFPWGMQVLHLRKPGPACAWTTVATNTRAKRLLGVNFDQRLEIPAYGESSLAGRPIDVSQSIWTALDRRHPMLLGQVRESSGVKPAEIFAVHALPMEHDCVAIVLHDASKDARARRYRRGAEARLEQICEATRAILWTADPDTLEFKSVTPEAQSILGYWVERWRREPNFWRSHVHPDDWEMVRSKCQEIAEHGGAGQFDCRMHDVDGNIHWFRTYLSLNQPFSGRAELSGVMVDVTDQKYIEQAGREYSAHVIRAQESERKRISRDLHDSIGQNLTGLHWSLARIGRGEAEGSKLRMDLKECEHMVQACMEEVRTVSQGLYPPAIDILGLAPALEWQAKRFAEQSALQIRMELPERMERMEADREITLFRVFQECVSNVRRHAESDAATVRLRKEASEVVLEVEDGGTGVPVDLIQRLERGRRGVGLLKMRERLMEMGGTLEIIPRTPGTLVRARMPHAEKSERSRHEVEAPRDLATGVSRRG